MSDIVDISDFDLSNLGTPDVSELFATGSDEDGNGEHAYPLTRFVPSNGEERVWAIPDLSAAKRFLVVKLWDVPWTEKVPPGYKFMFLRTKGGHDNPTEFQNFVWNNINARYVDKKGRAAATVMWLVPIVELYEGTWRHAIGELGVTAMDMIQRMNDNLSDSSGGSISCEKLPFAIKKSGQRDYSVKFQRKPSVDMILSEAEGEPWDIAEYVKLRAPATEQYLADIIRDSREQVAGAIDRATSPLSDDGADYEAAVAKLDSGTMAAIVESVSGAKLADSLATEDELREELLENPSKYLDVVVA